MPSAIGFKKQPSMCWGQCSLSLRLTLPVPPPSEVCLCPCMYLTVCLVLSLCLSLVVRIRFLYLYFRPVCLCLQVWWPSPFHTQCTLTAAGRYCAAPDVSVCIASMLFDQRCSLTALSRPSRSPFYLDSSGLIESRFSFYSSNLSQLFFLQTCKPY